MRTTVVRVVAINDVYELVHLPKLHTFLKKLKRRGTPATAVVLAGDFLSPSMLSSLDGGRGMVACLRAAGVTHACLGNHEADLRLPDLCARLQELSKSTTLLNTNVNVQQHINDNENVLHMTVPHATIFAPRKDSPQHIKLTMMGFLSDEANMFRDGTFRGLPIANVLDTFSTTYQTLHPTTNVLLPVTHQSMTRDRDLARRMLEEMKLTTSSYCHTNHDGTIGIILGGHEHEPMDETVTDQESSSSIRILKTGSDARLASLVEWTFAHTNAAGDPFSRPALVSVDAEFVDLSEHANSPSVQTLVNRKMAVLERMEHQIMVHNDFQKENVCLSSMGTRLSQTSVGSFFCMAIQEELDVDVAILNGAVLKGDNTYPDNVMTYADLRKELPFPTKMVVVPMTRKLLREAILFSRTQLEDQPTIMEGKEASSADMPAQTHGTGGDGIARRGYLQVNPDFCIYGNDNEDDETQIQVALPRNLLSGFCRIRPLMNLGEELKASGTFPEEDDFVPALDLVTRFCCKNRWLELSCSISRFEDLDMNRDGVLDRHEVKSAMTSILGTEPEHFFVDKMIDAIDQDGNGVIDEAEFNVLLSMIEHRHQN